MAVVQPYPISTVESRPAPNITRQVTPDANAFGMNQAKDLSFAGAQLDKGSDALMTMEEREAKIANDTRVQDLNNQYVSAQQKILFTAPDAFYRTQGADAINAAEPTTKALQDLKSSFLAQAGNGYQKDKLTSALDYHIDDATNAMSRHVAGQSIVWQQAVAKGTILNATNDMTLNFNDPAKVALHAEGLYKTAYDLEMKKTGSPEAATAQATAARSNALKAVITLQATENPNQAQRTLDANRDKLDATDIPALAATIKDADQTRKAKNIVSLVTATGGISPNYNSRVGNAENGGDYYTENKIGALGKYQMIPKTYTGLAQETDWGKGKSQAEIRKMLLDPKEGPKLQEGLQGLYNNRSVDALSKAALPVNDLTLYTTHHFGQGAGPELLKLPDDTPLQAGLLKAHGGDAAFVKEINDANPYLAKVQTVGDLKAILAQKIGAPLSLASQGTPQKPNLDAMLASGFAMAGSDPDQRDKVAQAIKTDYATKHAIYTSQIGAIEKQAFSHILSGGTVENLPSDVRGALDADGLAKVQIFEEKHLEKRRKENSNNAIKDLTDINNLGQLSPDEVNKRRNDLTGTEYDSWMKTARGGPDRANDDQTYERLQRGLGTRDMRDDIFAAHRANDINSPTRDALLEKNATFQKEGAPATPYKINHDMLTRSLDPGLMGGGISKEIYGRAIKEFDQYMADNRQREGETPEQFSKRVSDFAEQTKTRHQLITTQELSMSQPVPVHTPFNRGEMTALPKAEASKKIAAANGDLAARYQKGEITEDQYNLDAIALMGWLTFVQKRAETPPATPARR